MKHWLALALALSVACTTSAKAAGRITLDVNDVPLDDAIALLSAQSGTNVVTDQSVRMERVTLHLRNVSVDEALHAIAETHGLVVRHEGAIVVLGAATNASDERTATIPLQHAAAPEVAKEIAAAIPSARAVVADTRTDALLVTGSDRTISRVRDLVARLDDPVAGASGGTRTVSYRLRFLKPDDVVLKLKALIGEGAFLADEEQNAVLVAGAEALQARVREVIATVDVASPQVLFEVKVADVTPINDSSDVGLEFGGLDLTQLPTPGSTTYAFTGGTIPVNVRLNAMISSGHASILATPKLVTLNNKEADLTIGETYPIVYSTSVFGGQNVQYVDIGVNLKVTPTIGRDGSVTAELHPNYSELVGYTATGYPIVANRKIDSTLRVRDDQTIVLGGLMRDVSTETIEKVPWLSQIPILGKFFQNKATSRERDEIVFLITPHVIQPDAATTEPRTP